MSAFYTSIENEGNNILFRGVNEKGKRVKRKIRYEPSLFARTEKDTPFHTIKGEKLEEIKFDCIWDARNYIKQFKDVKNNPIYGNQNFVYSFIAEHFNGLVEYDLSKILVAYIDIEVGSENGFPRPEDAIEPVTAIALLIQNSFFVFGCGEFVVPNKPNGEPRQDIRYVQCKDEKELLESFLAVWNKFTPDIISGWSIEKFDIPYLVNRLKRLYGDDTYTQLSPWKIVKERTVYVMNREIQVYDLVGIATLDYIDLYKKYAPHPNQESYKLGDIAFIEIQEGKINYAEYADLHTLYKRNFQLFMEYNIQDTELVKKLNNKMRLIELAITMAYDNHVNYVDVYSQVRMWDSIIYSDLRSQNIIIPPKNRNAIKIAFAGGYVKKPNSGLYSWGGSFDLDGLYPHLIMQYNISPETLVEMTDLSVEVVTWFNKNRGNISVNGILEGKLDTSILKKHQLTMTPNGIFFTTKFHGFLPKLMASYYADRKRYKKEMLKYEKLLEADKGNKIYESHVTRNNNFQKAKKVTLNAAYGALGNEWFRFFDVRIAEGITLSGQLSDRWIINKLNIYFNKLLKTDGIDYIIAADTDSVYVSFESLVKLVAEGKSIRETSDILDKFIEAKVSPYISECYAELAEYMNAYEQKMSMKRENIFNRAIWTKKKRYILNVTNGEGGVVYEKPKIKITGLEAVRSSTPVVARNALKDCISIIMNEGQTELRRFVKEFQNKFNNMPLQDISIPKSCNNISRWRGSNGDLWASGCPHQVKGSIVYNTMIDMLELDKKYRKIMEGEKIKYFELKEPNPTDCNVISFPAILPDEFDLKEYLDYDKQFEKAFLDGLNIVLESIGWSLEEKSTLDALWG